MRPLTLALATCATASALAALALVMAARMDTPPPQPASFALVAFEPDASGALHAETLDSGLTLDDCAFAQGAAARLAPAMPQPSLVSCVLETGR